MFIITAVIGLMLAINASAQNPCRTPLGQNGRCIVIFECGYLFQILNKNPRTQEETALLKRSHCGFQNTSPKVCCPENPNRCTTPSGEAGECRSIHACDSILQLLNHPKPLPNNIVEYVRQSRCTGPAEYSVCCGARVPSFTEAPYTEPVEPGECKPSSFPPAPQSGCCGKDSLSADRIVGGNATAIDQFPWLALIEYSKENKIKLLCGAALVSQRYLVTAGHCVTGAVLKYGTPMNIRLGEYDTSSDRDCVQTDGGGSDCADPPVIIPIEQTIPHPEYDPNNAKNRRNDIAVIRMKKLAPYTYFIRPICLPSYDVTARPPNDFHLFAAGWGSTESRSSSNIKLYISLPFTNFAACQKAYSVPRRNVQLWDKQMCAGGEKGRDSCKGDSGGPLMFENDKTYELIGIVSFGPDPCGLEGVPGVYTKVYQYKDWIKSQIRA